MVNINQFKKSYGYLKVNSSKELLEAIPFLDRGEKIILTMEFSDEGELLNPISRKEYYKIQKIIHQLKMVSRAKNLRIEKFSGIFDGNVYLTIEKDKKIEAYNKEKND